MKMPAGPPGHGKWSSMDNQRSKNKGIFLVAVSAVAFGLLPIFTKIAYAAGAGTYTLLFLRYLVAASFMFLLVRVKELPLPPGRDIAAYLLLGMIGNAGMSFCYFTALRYTSSGVAALLLYTYPAMVMAGSAILFKEKVTGSKILALFLALAGAFIIIGADFRANVTGFVFAVLAAVIYSGYILASSRIIKDGMSIQASAFIMLGAGIVFGILNPLLEFAPPTGPQGILALILIALVCTVLSFWSFLTGLEMVGPSTAALVSTLEPVVTVLASVLILSEKLTARTVIGGCLVMAALFITSAGDRETQE